MKHTTLILTSALLLFSLAFVSANNITFPYIKSNNTFDIPTLNFSGNSNFTFDFPTFNFSINTNTTIPYSNYTTRPNTNITNPEPNITTNITNISIPITTYPRPNITTVGVITFINFPPIDNSNITDFNSTHTLTKKELKQIKKAERKATRAERRATRKAERDTRKAERKAARKARRKNKKSFPIPIN